MKIRNNKRFFSVLAAAFGACMGLAVPARAAVLLYSFESGDSPDSLDGFAPNGGGIGDAASTIGVTDGSGSLAVTTTSPGFTGILTTSIPAVLNDPAVDSISADVTIPATPVFGGTYADLGVIVFVANVPLSEFGEQFQVDPGDEQNIDLAPGTYTVTIPLTGQDPDTDVDESYAQLLGNGFVPMGFEFFFDENATNSVFLDKVEANGVSVPEPASLSMIGLAAGCLVARRRRTI